MTQIETKYALAGISITFFIILLLALWLGIM